MDTMPPPVWENPEGRWVGAKECLNEDRMTYRVHESMGFPVRGALEESAGLADNGWSSTR